MNEMKFIFPSYYVIESPKKILNPERLESCSADLLLIDCASQQVYLTNQTICDFLFEFRSPATHEQIQKKYGNIDTTLFFEEVVRTRFLIPETEFGAAHQFNTYTRNEFGEYKAFWTLKETPFIRVALAQKNEQEKFIIKHLKDGNNKEKQEKFNQEFLLYKILGEHPLICRVIEYNQEQHYAVLEYLQGEKLGDLIKNGELVHEQKISLAEQFMEVCAYMHSQKIIHGDIHANQFIINEKMELKALDFGFGYYLGDDIPNIITIRGGFMHYFDPESITPVFLQKISKYTPSFESEVYRIGCLLYYLFFESFPTKGFTWKEYYHQTTSVEPDIPHNTAAGESLPEKIRDIIKKCLEKEPEKRFHSAEELYQYYRV